MRNLLFLLPFFLGSCAIQHYQQGLEFRTDEYLDTEVGTMVREYRSDEGIRNFNDNSWLRYRINVHWAKDVKNKELQASFTLIEFQEAVPDLNKEFFLKINNEIIPLEFEELHSTLQIAGTDDEVEIKKFHNGKFMISQEIQDKIRRANEITLRLYAGLTTYTFELPQSEVDLLQNMIRRSR